MTSARSHGNHGCRSRRRKLMSTVFTATFRCTPAIYLKSTLILWINSGKIFKKPTRIPSFIGYVGGMNED
jgi:hypothetical protein